MSEHKMIIPEKLNPEAPPNSWSGIYLALFFFFPLGIWLSLSRLHRETDRYLSNGKRVAVIGWIFFGIGVIYYAIFQGMLAEGYTDIESAVTFFGWIAIGGLAFMVGNIRKSVKTNCCIILFLLIARMVLWMQSPLR